MLAKFLLLLLLLQILAEPLDMGVLWEKVPYIAEFVEDLPVGAWQAHMHQMCKPEYLDSGHLTTAALVLHARVCGGPASGCVASAMQHQMRKSELLERQLLHWWCMQGFN
jgi:hypothetical protein